MRPPRGVFLILLACGLFTSADARAGCGDHVVSLPNPAGGTAFFDLLHVAGAIPLATDQAVPVPAGRRARFRAGKALKEALER